MIHNVKVVIWGHKINPNISSDVELKYTSDLNTFSLSNRIRRVLGGLINKNRIHTHSYIHSSYYKAFSYLGYDVRWCDQYDQIDLNHKSKILFIAEDGDMDGLPISKNFIYVLHHVSDRKIESLGIRKKNVIRLENYTASSKKYHQISDLSHFDNEKNALHQSWGTDLLPDEFCDLVSFEERLEFPFVYYVGSLYESSLENARIFNKLLKNELGKSIVMISGANDMQAKSLIRSSSISIDFRGEHHKNIEYFPCRAFKNISYGTFFITDAKHIYEYFDGNVLYSQSPGEIIDTLYSSDPVTLREKYKNSIKMVREYHTYITKSENILRVMDQL